MANLKGTSTWCMNYSPEIEKEFVEKHKLLAGHEDNAKLDSQLFECAIHTFTDASFGVAYITLRSISGAIVYLYGFPICWRSKTQSVHSNSTCESEYIAAADALELTCNIQGLQNFLLGIPETEETPKGPLYIDNRSVVVTSRKGIMDSAEIPKRSRRVALRCVSLR